MMACAACGQARWTIHPGCARQRIFWTRSKQPWIALPEGDQIFETQPAT
jgi:hypothetical protein